VCRLATAQTDVGQHRAAGIFDDQCGSILDIACGEVSELLSQRRPDMALQGDIERGAEAGVMRCSGLRASRQQQPVGQMRCQVGGGENRVASAEYVIGPRLDGVASAGGQLAHAAVCGKGAGAACDIDRLGVGGADQHSEDQGFGIAQTGGTLVEQTACGRIDAGQFASKGRQIEIGLEYLALAPAFFQVLRCSHLTQLLCHIATRNFGAIVCIEQTGELHGQGRCAAWFRVQPIGQRRFAGCQPVDAGMLEEAFVFRLQYGSDQSGGNIFQRRPGGAPDACIDSDFLQQFAVAVEQLRFR
jgi:hypothetical protein